MIKKNGGLGQNHIDAFRGKPIMCDLKYSDFITEWYIFGAVVGKMPSDEGLDNFDGFINTESKNSINDYFQWINDLKIFIISFVSKPSNLRFVGICIGHQLIVSCALRR